jgi:hypothetical protein
MYIFFFMVIAHILLTLNLLNLTHLNLYSELHKVFPFVERKTINIKVMLGA